jgi:phospholipid/cholesterol/gamma-HCH transport system substrate-binding protein
MENKAHALLAGLFTLLLLAGTIAAALWLGRDTTSRTPFELVTHASVSGLSPQSSVRFRGLEVGKVESIAFDPKVVGQILVRINVQEGTPVSHSTYAELGYQGVTGLAYIELDDDGRDPSLLVSSNIRTARINIVPGLFDKVAGRGESIMKTLDETVSRLDALLAPQNQSILTDTLLSLNNAAKELNGLGTQLTPAVTRLPGAIDDTKTAIASFDVLAHDYDKLAQRLQADGGALEHVATSLQQFDAVALSVSNATLPRFDALSETATGSARAVTRAADVFGSRPQSILFGNAPIAPGPGEPGFGASR